MMSDAPPEVTDFIRSTHQLYQKQQSNPAQPFRARSTAHEKFPMEQLMQYKDSAVIQPYITAKRYNTTGVQLCLELGQVELGCRALAAGLAACHRAVLLPPQLLPLLESYLRSHSGDVQLARLPN